MTPKVGQTVTVFLIGAVSGIPVDGVTGVVTEVLSNSFYFMPNEPDPTTNSMGYPARRHNPDRGWIVSLKEYEKVWRDGPSVYMITEEAD